MVFGLIGAALGDLYLTYPNDFSQRRIVTKLRILQRKIQRCSRNHQFIKRRERNYRGYAKVASKHGENAVNAFVRRDEISAYIIDENLDITATQLDELLKVHFNGEDIKQTKSELDAAKILKIKGETEQEQVKKIYNKPAK